MFKYPNRHAISCNPLEHPLPILKYRVYSMGCLDFVLQFDNNDLHMFNCNMMKIF